MGCIVSQSEGRCSCLLYVEGLRSGMTNHLEAYAILHQVTPCVTDRLNSLKDTERS
jgi:hypothetical protein